MSKGPNNKEPVYRILARRFQALKRDMPEERTKGRRRERINYLVEK